MSWSYAPSIKSASLDSSILREVELHGWQIGPIQSDTNSTATGIPGPGRVVGSLIARAGRRLEIAIDRFAEQQLRLGPAGAARRLASALHDIHLKASHCRSDNSYEVHASDHATDILIWVCNGYCSQCYFPYLPRVLSELPETALKAMSDLIKYVQSSQHPSNIGLASIYIRLLILSSVLAPALIRRLDLLRHMKDTRAIIWPKYTPNTSDPDSLDALRAAIAAVDELRGRHHRIRSASIRVKFEEVIESWESMQTLSERFIRVRDEEWASRDITSAQLLTKVSAFVRDHGASLSTANFKQLLSIMTRLRSSSDMPHYLVDHSNRLYVQAASALFSSTALMVIGHKQGLQTVAWLPDLNSTKLLMGSNDGTIHVWNSFLGRDMYKLDGHISKVFSVAVSPDGSMISSGSQDQTIRLWSTSATSSIAVLHGHSDYVSSVTFSPNGVQVASASRDSTIRLWDIRTKSESHRLIGHSGYVSSVAISPGGSYLISGGHDNSVRIWDMRTGRQTAALRGHNDWVYSVAISSDGERIASGSRDSTIRLWNAQSGQETLRLSGHTDSVRSLHFASDDTHLVSASRDRTVRLWNIHRGHQIVTLRGHHDNVSSVAFSPNDLYIASGSRDRTVRVWDVSILKSEGGVFDSSLHTGIRDVSMDAISEVSEVYYDAEEGPEFF